MKSVLRAVIALSMGVAGVAGIGAAAVSAAVPQVSGYPLVKQVGPRVGDVYGDEATCKAILRTWGMDDRFKCTKIGVNEHRVDRK
ncbi:hypothetical protein [Nocardia wallacei]|uniref:hypothetical protein n=1 Tax=Nocardia wallacei TaxID=480035 RepID=UPI0024558FF1|nr:hypothetical protein [Nocardia wallacei]